MEYRYQVIILYIRKPRIKIFKFENNQLMVTEERIDKVFLNGLNFSEIKDWKKVIFQNTVNVVRTPVVVNTPKMVNSIKTMRRKSFFGESSKTSAK